MKKTDTYLIETDPVDPKTNEWVLQALDPRHREALAQLHAARDRTVCQCLNCRFATPNAVGWNLNYEEWLWNPTALVDTGDEVFFTCADCFDFLMPKPVDPYVPPVWIG